MQYEDVDVNKAHIGKLPEDTVDKLIAEGEIYRCAGGAVSAYHKPFTSCVQMYGSELRRFLPRYSLVSSIHVAETILIR